MADPNLLLSRAKSALLARDYQLAAKYYKTLISENPDVPGYKIDLGNLYVKAGEDDKALDVFKAIEKTDSENLTVLMAMAGIYRRKKMFDESVAVLEQALLIGNNSPEDLTTINYNLGFTYRQMGNNDEAIRCFEKVIEQNPKDVLAYNHLGAIHALQGDQTKAIEAYQRGLQFDPNHPILHFNIARSYAEIGESQKALSHYEAALRAKPGWLDAIEEYTNLLLKSNKVEQAEETVQNALKLNPDDVKMHTSMGNVYNRKSIYDNAEIEFKKALSGDDEYTPALTGLAHSLEKQGKHEEAAETINKAQRLNPDDVGIIKQTAQVLLSANFLGAAYEKISRLWEINQNDPQTISLLGQYYIEKGEDSKVESCFDKIQSVAPEYKDVYRDWGARYAQKGDNQKAEQYLKTAIRQNPKDAESMVYLGDIYENQKKPEAALEMYKKARSADGFNDLSQRKAQKLKDEGILDLGVIKFPDEDSSENENSQNQKEDKNPDLLTDVSNPIDDFNDFGDKTVGEIELAEDDDLTEKKSDENKSEEKSENSGDIADEDFDFDQFGMEKLKEENPEEISVASIDDLMQKEDVNQNDKPADIDELVDDGAPLDEEDDAPDMEFIPDGSDFLNSPNENPKKPEQLIPEDEIPEDDEDEEENAPDLDSSQWQNDSDKSDKNEEKNDVKADSKLFDAINDLKDQVKAASKIAEDAKDSTEKLMEEMKKRDLETPDNIDETIQDFEPEEDSEKQEELYVEPEIPESGSIEDEISSEDIPEEDSVSEKEEIQAAENQKDELSPEELMMKRAIDMLPEIVSGLEDRASFFKFKNYLKMFETLRDMLDYLPDSKKQEFLSSKNRILLDYVISKLSGKPGLYATAKGLHDSGIIHENPALKGSDNSGIDLVKEVLTILDRLSENLDDETLRIALKNEKSELEKKL